MKPPTAIGDQSQSAQSYRTAGESSKFEWDVFISFRGQDTRRSFVRDLISALQMRGVRTFVDEDLQKGQQVSDLLKAMEASRIFVIVLSKGYADSMWCLKELSFIVQTGRLILPVFYDVQPSDVRNQRGPFEAAFRHHQKNKKIDQTEVKEWRDALGGVGEISGYDLTRSEGGQLKRIFEAIVKRILRELPSTLMPPEALVGIAPRLEHMLELLDIEADDVRIIGITGMGGLGKTTLAKAVFNAISYNYHASSFIPNVGDLSREYNGLVGLQRHLVQDILKDESAHISDVNEGISIIRRAVQGKRVLIVLDYVDDIEQLQALACRREWFTVGSRIIITTRDEHVLHLSAVREHKIYRLGELNSNDALQLFCYHAFGKQDPPEEYMLLCEQVVSTCGGLPLVIEVVASLFFDLESLEKGISMLEKLKVYAPSSLLERLTVSFDTLDIAEKEIFLDVASFFVGNGKENAFYMWEDCGLFPSVATRVLVQKSLVKFNDQKEFEMHDLIQQMGKEIIRGESRLKPGGRSRLPDGDYILDILEKREGTEKVKGLSLNMENFKEEKRPCLQAEAFGDMPNLRLLRLNSVKMGGDYQHFPKGLRWFEWKGCSLDSLPDELDLQNLVILDLSNSMIKELSLNKVHDRLVVLNLSYCNRLSATPEFLHLPMLKKLVLDGCGSLTQVHDSIGFSKNLLHLSLKECSMLKHLPHSLGELQSLETLKVSGCSRLSNLPDSIGDIETLKELELDSTNITTVPSSIGSLVNLRLLSLKGCKYLTALPESIGRLKSLTNLVLDFTRLSAVPDSIGSLAELRLFSLEGCMNLMALPDSIGNLISLTDLVLDFTLIKEIPHSVASLKNLQRVSLIGCLKELHDSVRETDWFASLAGKILMAESKTKPPTYSAVSSGSFSQKRRQKKRRRFSKKRISEPEITTFSSSLQEFSEKGVSQPEMTTFSSSLQELSEKGVSPVTTFSSSLQEFSEKEVSKPEMTSFSSSLQEPLKHPQVSKLGASYLPKQFKYDVYLSFKREDAGNAFAINLSRALEQHGVATFLDNGTLSKQDKYSGLLDAIANSTVAIPILTDSYFRSRWCLLEIANAVECCRMILPLFIDHDPIHIKEQSGPLALVFQSHKENAPPEELDHWREALSEVGNASGYHLHRDADGDEVRLVQLVVKRVLSILNPTQCHPFPYTIGMKTQIDHCMKLLDIESGDVRMVGIVGVGGIGKTTLAKALFSRISNCYEASCFISNWRTKAMEQPNALVSLQNELIRGIFKDKVKPVNDVDEGMDVIRSEIQSKILLLVLDDADQTNLISAWVGERYSFHPGSRIIIVCRDVEILRKNKVYEREIYQLQKLSEDESVELFNLYAFGRDKPNEQYQKISKRIASSVGGLPLNLKVFGSFFSDLRNMSKWEAVLEKLTSCGTAQEISNQSTNLGQNVGPVAEQAFGSTSSPSRDRESRQQNLETPMRPSMAPDSSSNRDANTGRTLDPPTSERDYGLNPNPNDPDGLEKIIYNLDATAREIFLDIACFFIGKNRENAMHIWRGCEFSGGTNPDKAIQELLRVQLVSINIKDDTFYMDEKTKEMGRKMVEREDEELGRRSRLWEHEKSLHVLNNRRGTDRIQGIGLNLASTRLRTAALSPLSKLRLMCVDNANFVGGFKGLAVEPRWLKWQSTDSSSPFPGDFNLHKVAVLDISKSSLNNVWGQKRFPKSKAMKWMKSLICGSSVKKDFENLKVLELKSSENQTAFPDLSTFPCLVKLTLDGCCRLAEVRTSIERQRDLTCLKIRNCSILQSLPANFSSLVSLKILDLSGCSSLSDLPGEVGNLQSLMELLLSETAVKVIPDSINQLRKLERLLLDNCKILAKLPGSLEGLKSLQVLSAKSCKLLATLPTSIGNVSNLTHLLLDGTMIEELPDTVGELENLSDLLLDGTMIKELPNTVGELENLSQCSVCRCENLRRLPASIRRLRYLEHLDLSATGIRELPDDFGALSSLTELQMSNCKEIKELPESFANLRLLSSLDLRSNTNLTSIPSLGGLSQLKQLNVVNCENLKMIPQLPSSLTKLLCYGCTALERLEDVSNLENLIELNLTGCTRLIEINGIDSLAALRRFHMSGCKRLSNASRNQLVQKIFEHLESFSIPGGEIPRVFTNRQLSYEVPVSLDVREGMELLICLVVAVQEQAGCWEPNIKVETEAEGEKIVKLPGVALPSKDDNLCLWHYKEADRVFPRGSVKITLVHHEWIKDEARNGGLCEPEREVEAANGDGQQVSVFECIARCCRTSNST